MVSLASIFFTLISIAPSEFPVVWQFSAGGCSACHLRQVEIMKMYFDSSDKITIIGRKRSKEVEKLEELLKSHFKDVKIRFMESKDVKADNTGFTLSDPLTGESFAYATSSGTYSIGRAEILLSAFRDTREP